MSIVGDDGALFGRKIIALIDADQQLVLAEADIVAVLQLVIMVSAQGYLSTVDVGSVGAGVDEDVVSGPKIDPGMFAREVTLRVG